MFSLHHLNSFFQLKMKRIAFSVLLLIGLIASCDALALWPKPHSLEHGNGARRLDSRFTIKLTENEWKQDKDLQEAIHRTLKRINSSSIWPYTIDYGASKAEKASKSSPITALEIRKGSSHKRNTKPFISHTKDKMKKTGNHLHALSVQPLEHLDESYTLQVPQDGVAVLHSSNALGVLRGLTTFSQLVYHGQHGHDYVDGTPIVIEDKAHFPYRGIMIDTARNFIPPNVIKHQLDAMELVKLNQLHWHITDTSSWPLGLKTKGMDVLARKGAYPNSIYEPETIKHIVKYAAQRGISVIIEIDMPGHQYMGVKDYPGDLITCGNRKDWDKWAAEPPSGHLDIRKPAATELMKNIFSELSHYLTSPYISTGNDEVEAQCYGLKKSDKKGMDKILAPFVDSVHSHLKKLGKTPMVWEEATLDYPKTSKVLKSGTLVEAWTSSANVKKILEAREDTHIVHAPSDYFYLDCGMGDFTGGNGDGKSWCDYNSWKRIYSFDPYNGTHGIKNGRERIAGGETALWGEQTDEANLESLLWPRAASAAEVFWTGQSAKVNGQKHKRNLKDALPRLLELRGRLRSIGIRAAPLQPQWCAIRPGQCDAAE